MNTTTTARAENAVRTIITALLEAVQESPHGAPSGPLYAAVMHILTLDQYEAIMGALVTAGKITKRGHQYFPVGLRPTEEKQLQ